MSVNYAYYYEDVRNPNAERVVKYFPKEWNVFVFKFLDEEIDFGRTVNQEFVYDDPIFSRKLTKDEIIEAEAWLGHPFYLILQYSYIWDESRNFKLKELEIYYDLLAKLVIYFRSFFTKNKIEFFSLPVDGRFPFVCSLLTARKLGIKIILPVQGRLSKTMVLYDSDFEPIFWKDITENDIENAKFFFSNRYSKQKRAEYSEIKDDNINKSNILLSVPVNTIKLYRKFFPKLKHHPLNQMQYAPLSKTIKKRFTVQARKLIIPMLINQVDLDNKFLFFPIHHDEETHLSWKEHFLDQYEIIEKLAESLPLDIELFVKPHPNWLCSDVPITKALRLNKFTNIKFIKPELSAIDLIKKCNAVVTLNSTTGLEAIALNKPVLTFGHSFYAKKNVAMCVHDIKDLPDAVRQVIYEPEKTFNQHERDILLANYCKHLFPFEAKIKTRTWLTNNDGLRIANEIKKYVTYVKDQT